MYKVKISTKIVNFVSINNPINMILYNYIDNIIS